MNLKDILAISGLPGLYKFVSQGKNSIIVESLADKKRSAAYASVKVSALKDVAIFTADGEAPLKDVFSTIYEKEKGGPAINPKTATDDQLKAYFAEVLPDYDREKVYLSDIRKVFMWYNALHQADLLNIPEDEPDMKDAVEDKEKTAEDGKEDKEAKATADTKVPKVKKESKGKSKKSPE